MKGLRDRLIDAAAERLDAGGPAAVTLRDVGRMANVSHNAPYRHFSEKDALLAAIATRELRMLAAEWRRVAEGTSDLRTVLRDYVRWAVRNPERFRLTYGRWTAPDEDLVTAGGEAHVAFTSAVETAQRGGELPLAEPARVGALLLSLANGAASLALVGHLSRDGKGGVDPDDLVCDLIDYLRAPVASRHAAVSG